MSPTDAPPRRREPAFNVPAVIVVVCVVLLAIYGLFSLAPGETKDAVIAEFAFMPARAAIALDWARSQLQESAQAVPQATLDASIGDGGGRWWTLVTYALLHGSWAHVGFNCLWLVAFGSPVARRFAAPRFLALLLVAAVAGAVVQFFWDMASFVPVIGASAGVSGAMGAAVRFVFRSNEEPRQIFDRARLEQAYRLPALSLREIFTNRTALAFVVFWFATDLVFGLYPSLSGISDAPVAWQAHIGGFLVGLLAFPLFDRRHPPAAEPIEPIEPEDSADLGAAALPPDA